MARREDGFTAEDAEDAETRGEGGGAKGEGRGGTGTEVRATDLRAVKAALADWDAGQSVGVWHGGLLVVGDLISLLLRTRRGGHIVPCWVGSGHLVLGVTKAVRGASD